jgi:hypothetical protein
MVGLGHKVCWPAQLVSVGPAAAHTVATGCATQNVCCHAHWVTKLAVIYGQTVADWTAQVVVPVLTAGHVVDETGQAVGFRGQVVGIGSCGHTVVFV